MTCLSILAGSFVAFLAAACGVPSSQATLAATSSPPIIDLDAIPPVDVTSHSVSLEDLIFETFGGSFVRLSQASDALIRRLRDAIRLI